MTQYYKYNYSTQSYSIRVTFAEKIKWDKPLYRVRLEWIECPLFGKHAHTLWVIWSPVDYSYAVENGIKPNGFSSYILVNVWGLWLNQKDRKVLTTYGEFRLVRT